MYCKRLSCYSGTLSTEATPAGKEAAEKRPRSSERRVRTWCLGQVCSGPAMKQAAVEKGQIQHLIEITFENALIPGSGRVLPAT